MLRSAVALVAILAFVSSSTAQQQPYGGLQSRTVKALSPQQIDDLKSGRGMGLALAAELNGYPGPLHVLELATPLALTEAQRQKMQDLIAAMKADTIPLGERLIAHEQELDCPNRWQPSPPLLEAHKVHFAPRTCGIISTR